MSEEEKEYLETLIKRLSYCELEYEENGYLSVGKFDAIKQAINVIEKQQKEIEELKKDNENQWRHRCKMAIELDNNVVSKDKIREKIKEINKKAFEYKCNYSEYYYKKEILNELLEE